MRLLNGLCFALSSLAQYRQDARDRWPCLFGDHERNDVLCRPPACVNCGRTLEA